ncbi:hypothetical protein SAMN02982990_02768 [Photorhabdus luminescens]|uniref:Uncharacterized protein n=1 Tax=Photorhabdus luminescens TaxID=29488 RepID=A0A1G5R0B8_PHOLU|nr:hypothetical protein SAMN02982990_02768 [Photorhabdus luminescens]
MSQIQYTQTAKVLNKSLFIDYQRTSEVGKKVTNLTRSSKS